MGNVVLYVIENGSLPIPLVEGDSALFVAVVGVLLVVLHGVERVKALR